MLFSCSVPLVVNELRNQGVDVIVRAVLSTRARLEYGSSSFISKLKYLSNEYLFIFNEYVFVFN